MLERKLAVIFEVSIANWLKELARKYKTSSIEDYVEENGIAYFTYKYSKNLDIPFEIVVSSDKNGVILNFKGKKMKNTLNYSFKKNADIISAMPNNLKEIFAKYAERKE